MILKCSTSFFMFASLLYAIESFVTGPAFFTCSRRCCLQKTESVKRGRLGVPAGSKSFDGTDGYETGPSQYWEYLSACLNELGELETLLPYPMPDSLQRQTSAIVGGKSRKEEVIITLDGYQTSKIRQLRSCILEGNGSTEVLNLVAFPRVQYDVPIFGADLVSLPGQDLIAIDFQPIFRTKEYQQKYFSRLQLVYDTYKGLAQNTPPLPEDVRGYFSPYALWIKIPHSSGSSIKQTSVKRKLGASIYDAFKEYMSAYKMVLAEAEPVTDPEVLNEIRIKHQDYSSYRHTNDPARPLLSRFFGPEKTEKMLSEFLFDAHNGKVL
mmetsp:Transcript_40724/g.66628  ORF Transcript_40724/g.66628 Transcript_40724/m.66628 type:complete len:324 (+) Transcript_40724:36-1007(+)